MLKNYLTIIWRTVYRQPIYTILNLSCLTVGIAAALLILLYIDFELNFDRFHTQASQVYRIETNSIQTREKVIEVDWQTTAANFAPIIKKDYPEIDEVVRFYQFFQNEEIPFQYRGETIEEEEVIVVDSTVFDVFSFDFIRGNPQNALNGPNKIVISAHLAQRIFGEEDPLGKVLESQLVHGTTSNEDNYAFTVTGVFRDLPLNTHLFTHALISAETDQELNNYYFNRFNVSTYVLLNKGADPLVFAPKLTAVYDNYLDPEVEPVMVNAQHELIPLTKIHANQTGGLTYVYIFGAIGILLLLISGISYVNLVTAQASRRSMEIGIRKVLGSNRKQLIFQFLSESLLFTSMAILLALVAVDLTIEPLNNLLGLHLIASELWRPKLLLAILSILVFVGILGGSYPAFFLSSFHPIAVMKGKIAKGVAIRKVLVAVQFAVVIFVLTSTGLIYDQLQFLQEKYLGFDQEHILELTFSGREEIEKASTFKEAILRHPNILASTTSNFTPGLGGMIRRPVSANGTAGQESQFAHVGYIDYDYLSTLDISLIEGRNFSPEFPGDEENSVLVNESMIRNFGLEAPVIGEEVRWGGSGNPHFFRVIGVIKDFHQNSLHNPIASQIFSFRPAQQQMMIKVGTDLPNGIAKLEESWATLFPDRPFEYRFLDETLQSRYEADQRRGEIFLSFSFLTIFISFLGLFGLASYLAKQRTKEIGVRKVFGAGTWSLIVLMTKNFLLLVILAALPAFVLTVYVVRQWLENFAFQSNLNYFLFGFVLLFTLLLTFFTTGFQAFRAAQLNPAKTLKYE